MIPHILALLLCSTLAHYIPNLEIPNVGTVLFTSNDLEKSRWSRSKIELLRTRKYFQNLIPSPRLTDTVTEEYLNYLLNYFKDSYATIKREIDNTALREMMETAYSDTIGGFLKVWVLPVTKYGYYGGSISLDNALKVFKLYENIKTNLHSDGQNWQNPNNNLLNYVAINIAPPEHTYARSMGDTCEELAYFEKTDKGLTIPLPIIDWSISPSTMFLPLKNRSLVPLNSINSSKTLQKYYDVAQNCMRTQNSESLIDFEERFQEWLGTDIIPHLNDTNFYIPFGNVLGLLNTTKSFENNVIKECEPKKKVLQFVHGFPVNLASKKILIIGILLFIEIVWCIPTLMYVLLSYKKKKRTPKDCFSWVRRKSHRNDYCNFASDNKREIGNETTNDRETCTSAYVDLGVEPKSVEDLKLFFKPQSKQSYVQFSSYGSKFIIKDEISRDRSNSNKLFTVKHSRRNENSTDRISKPLPSVNMITNEDKNKLNVDHKYYCDDIKDTKISTAIHKAESIITFNNHDSEKTIPRITYSQCSNKALDKKSQTIRSVIDSIADTKYKNLNFGFSPADCKKQSEHKSNANNVTEKKIRPHKIDDKDPFLHTKVQHKRSILQSKRQVLQSKKQIIQSKREVSVTTKNERKDNNQNLHKRVERKPFIPVDKELAEAQLKVGITTYNECSGSQKASKIPRRLIIIDYKQNREKVVKCPENKHDKIKNIQGTKIKCLEDSNAKGNLEKITNIPENNIKPLDDSCIKNNLDKIPNIPESKIKSLKDTKIKSNLQKVENVPETKIKCLCESPNKSKVEKKTNVVSKLRCLGDHANKRKLEKNTNVVTKIRYLDDSIIKSAKVSTENKKMNLTL